MKIRLYIYLFSVAVFSVAAATPAFSQSKTWTGAAGTSWHTAGNWNPSGVPAAVNDVTIPNTANKPVITSNVTVRNITLNGGTLDIRNNATVSLSNNFAVQAGATLNIPNGHLNIPSGTINYNWATNNINMTSGSITIGSPGNAQDFEFASNPSVINLGSGTLTVYGNYTQNNRGTLNAGTGELIVHGAASLEGILNGDDADITFGGNFNVQGGGRINLEEGNITFNGSSYIGNSGFAYFGSGTVDFNGLLNVKSNGHLHVQDAYVKVNDNLDLDSGATLTIDDGTLHISGNTLFSWSGEIDAGNGTIILEGDLSSPTGSTFDPGTSTVIFAGDNQTIDMGQNDIYFYDVIIEEGTTVNTGVNGNTIYIENDLTIGEGGELNINEDDDDKVNVRGEVNGDEEAYSPQRPYAVTATAPNVNTLVLVFNMEMDKTTAETSGNYTIRVYNQNHNGSQVTVHSATLNTGGNSRTVTISMGTIQEEVQYEVLISTNVRATNNKSVSPQHYKYFQKTGPVIFYSRQNGNWNSNTTWSRISHTGAAAGETPSNTPDATVYVGNGNTVSINSSVSVVNLAAVEAKAGSKLEVIAGGELSLGTKTITGTGTFEITTGTLLIGSPAGITASGASGNIQTGTRNFGTAASYTYNGTSAQNTGNGLPAEVKNLTVSNSAGVTISSNLEVTGTLSLTSGNFIINSGNSLIANTKSIGTGRLVMKRLLAGDKGWRLLSSPLASDYDDFFDGITTQGYPGASLGNAPQDSLQPNVMYYLEDYPGTDNQRWRTPLSADTELTPGRGLYTYVFGDVPGDNRYNDVLPAELSVEGQEHAGPIDFGITYTTTADSGWSLIGNPYAASIDWDKSAAWTKTNIDNTIYIWDYSTNQYKTWNGITGDLANGLITPFQGFWVKANGNNPVLKVEEDAKTFGGAFVGKIPAADNSAIPGFSLVLSDDKNSAATHFMFSDDGRNGKDAMDAYRLVPPPGISSYLDLASITRNGDRFSINNLPRRFGVPLEIPLDVGIYENGFSTSKPVHFLFQNIKNIPHGWTITLIDTKTGEETDILEKDTYLFDFEGEKAKAAPNNLLGATPEITRKAKSGGNRFIVRITPGEDAAGLPDRIELMQNFPNPFNPSTNIRFTLPLQSKVSLKVYDILGREVAVLVSKELDAGEYTFQWHTNNLASGVYIYRLVTEGTVSTKKMTLIK